MVHLETLQTLHERILSTDTTYTSMMLVRSQAVGEPFVEGRSDYDIVLSFDVYNSRIQDSLSNFLRGLPFDDSYLFTPLAQGDFVGPLISTHDFSHRFRSRVLFGDDLVPITKLPSLEDSWDIYHKGILRTRRRLEHRLAHIDFWSLDKCRGEFWKLFKHSLMYLAVRAYCESGSYPRSRGDIVDYFCDERIVDVACKLYGINTASKKKMLSAGVGIVEFLRE